MIQALIFDMDGTLVDSEPVHYKAWQATLIRNGVAAFPFDDFVEYVGASNEQLAQDYIRSCALNVGVEELVLEKQAMYLQMIPAIRMLPGTAALVKRSCRTFRLGIASSSHRIELTNILATLGLQDCFDQVVGGDMVERKKPDPEIYLRILDLMGLDPLQCVAFEDSESGVNAAKEAGLYTLAIPTPLSLQHDFQRADRVLERIDQVDEDFLQGLCAGK